MLKQDYRLNTDKGHLLEPYVPPDPHSNEHVINQQR